MIERLLFAKIPAWSLVLMSTAALGGLVGYGYTLHSELKSPGKYGRLGTVAVDIATIPLTIKELLHPKDRMAAERTERLAGKSGWNVAQAITDPAEGYLLLSRYSGDLRRAVIELVDLTDMSVRYSWLPDADVLLKDASIKSAISDTERWNRDFFRPAHPILLADGNMILKDHETPLMRVDACARLVWSEQTDIYHHSTNLGPDGTIWVPTRIEPTSVSANEKYNDDALAQVGQDGKLIQSISLTETFIKNGLRPVIFGAGAFRTDSFHLNDIEPVMQDGPFWKKGDLFISMRHLSMVMLYRPSTGEIIWSKQGPWMAQHDVDIINDHTIGVFDNRAFDIGKGWYVDGTNDVVYYDFASGSTYSPFQEAMRKADVVTLTEGLFDLTPGGRMIVEEENSGRVIIFNRDGSVAAEYVNRAQDGIVYGLGWSRWIDRSLGDQVLKAVAGVDCDG